jgi:serine protease Do
MKRTFATTTSLGCIALLALTLQTIPVFAKDNPSRDKNDKAEKSDEASQKHALPKLNIDSAPIQREGSHSYAPIIKKAAPSVVSVSSSKTVAESEARNPLLNDPLLRRFFGQDPDAEEDQPEENPRRNNRRRPRSHQEMGLGSGVIVSEDGYIITNNHVVEGADDVKVETASGAKYTAKVIGADPATDTAVVKIDGTGLPAITIGNSEGLEVGDVVLAIGNPFGIGQTVTMGIISGVGRTELGIVDYEDFIQTDAAINMGNSGGALIDAQGRLIGINAAILSRTGGNIGVGFAVPINMARQVVENMIEYGKVMRGYLGLKPQRVTPEFARKFNLPEATGALVADFPLKGPSPARDAGIKAGDIITEFNGKKISDDKHLRLMVSQTPPNTDSTVKLFRDGKEKNIKLKIGEFPPEQLADAEGNTPGAKPGGDNESLEGVTVDDLDTRMRSQFRVPRTVEGALVTDVDPDSKSYEAGLRPGDVILEIDHKPVRDSKEAVSLSEKAKGPDTLLRIWSRGNSRYLTVENGTNESSTKEKENTDKKKPATPRR